MALTKRMHIVASVLLPAVHLCLCIATSTGLVESEGSWSWFAIFLIDFPFSIALLPLIRTADPLVVFGVLGTLWWYVISRVGIYVVRRFIKHRQRP